MTPYFADENISLYHGDFREVLSALGPLGPCVLALG